MFLKAQRGELLCTRPLGVKAHGGNLLECLAAESDFYENQTADWAKGTLGLLGGPLAGAILTINELFDGPLSSDETSNTRCNVKVCPQ